jgi:hypothetical protein
MSAPDKQNNSANTLALSLGMHDLVIDSPELKCGVITYQGGFSRVSSLNPALDVTGAPTGIRTPVYAVRGCFVWV